MPSGRRLLTAAGPCPRAPPRPWAAAALARSRAPSAVPWSQQAQARAPRMGPVAATAPLSLWGPPLGPAHLPRQPVKEAPGRRGASSRASRPRACVRGTEVGPPRTPGTEAPRRLPPCRMSGHPRYSASRHRAADRCPLTPGTLTPESPPPAALPLAPPPAPARPQKGRRTRRTGRGCPHRAAPSAQGPARGTEGRGSHPGQGRPSSAGRPGLPRAVRTEPSFPPPAQEPLDSVPLHRPRAGGGRCGETSACVSHSPVVFPAVPDISGGRDRNAGPPRRVRGSFWAGWAWTCHVGTVVQGPGARGAGRDRVPHGVPLSTGRSGPPCPACPACPALGPVACPPQEHPTARAAVGIPSSPARPSRGAGGAA